MLGIGGIGGILPSMLGILLSMLGIGGIGSICGNSGLFVSVSIPSVAALFAVSIPSVAAFFAVSIPSFAAFAALATLPTALPTASPPCITLGSVGLGT